MGRNVIKIIDPEGNPIYEDTIDEGLFTPGRTV